MSSNISIILLWSKSSKTRRKILNIIQEEEKNNRPIYVSNMTTILNNQLQQKEQISRSAVRKHIKVLLESNLISILNPGGKPEYLTLTKTGLDALKKFVK